MEIATATGRLKAIRRTKFYDLLAAVPLIAWYLFCAAHMLPLLADQVALIKLFVRTDPSVLPSTLVLDALSHVCTLIFLVALVVMFAVRHTPQHTALGLYPRLAAVVAGAFVRALPGIPSVAYRRHRFRNLFGACTRAFDQHPAGRSETCNQGAVCPRAPSTLSWRDGRARRSCHPISVRLVAVSAGTGMRNST